MASAVDNERDPLANFRFVCHALRPPVSNLEYNPNNVERE